MQISDRHRRILQAEICPYCNSETVRTNETDIYGREYSGKDVVKCSNYPKCDSYVGCHKTGEPLGRLANNELRQLKVRAHEFFDKLWKEDHYKRGYCYQMLSEDLGIPQEYTHIGMFSEQTLRKVILWSKTKLSGLC